MEYPPNPEGEHNNGDRATDATPNAEANPQPQAERRVFDAFREALRRGAEDARTAAEKAVPKVKSAAADAVYWTAYGVSFATVFQWTFAKGLAPESLKAGFRDGVKAASDAAERWTEKLTRRNEQTTDATANAADPSAGAVQPGAA